MTTTLFTPKTNLSQTDVDRLIACCEHPQFQRALFLIYYLGIRPSECLRIQINDIHLQAGLLSVQAPSGCIRQLPLSLACAERIPVFHSTSYLFDNGHRGMYHLRSLQIEAKKAAKKAGIHLRYGVSSLRHAFAERLVSEGMSVTFLQAWLGIQHEKSMNRYL